MDAEPDVMPDLEAYARAGLVLFQELDGFVAGALHKSTTEDHWVQHLQWQSEEAHYDAS